MTIHEQSATLLAERQPDEDGGYVGPYPAATLPGVEVKPPCGARIQRQPGEVCADSPVEGRRRCRIHGGLTPVGRDSPHFTTGRHSRHPVPLTQAERERYDRYRVAVYDIRREDLAGDLALARIMYERAVSSGSSGVAEAGAVARLALAHARITEGRVIRFEVDEATFAPFHERWMAVVEKHVMATLGPEQGKQLLGAIGVELREREMEFASAGSEPQLLG